MDKTHSISVRDSARASSTTRRAALASLAALAAAPAAAAAPAGLPSPSDGDRRLLALLEQFRAIHERRKDAFAVANAAEMSAWDARAANPYPVVSEEDRVFFNYAVSPGDPWTPERLAHFNTPLFRCELAVEYSAAERARGRARIQRMAELAPGIAAADEARRPSQEAHEAAQAVVEDLLDRELAILSDAAEIDADTMAGLVAKASLLVLYAGGLDQDRVYPDERARDSILRDVLTIGGAHA